MDSNSEKLAIQEDEYNEKNRLIHLKYKNGEKLSTEESYFLCDHVHPNTLLLLPICIDEFYTRYFLDFYADPKIDNWEERHFDYFKSIVRDWEGQIMRENHPEQLLKLVSEEIRKELKKYRKQKREKTGPFDLDGYLNGRLDIIAWSKYRYLIIKRTLDIVIPNGTYILHLNAVEITFNYYTLVHIVSRHFGQIMKPFDSEKDHFHKEFYYNNTHLLLEKIFKDIDDSGYYIGQDITEINFKYKGTIYKIYCGEETIHSKGQPNRKIMRLNTFFPVGEEKMLQKLEYDFIEKKVNDDLSIFCLF